jgi:hypothetical protein
MAGNDKNQNHPFSIKVALAQNSRSWQVDLKHLPHLASS